MFERLLTNRMFTLSVASLLAASVVVILQLPGIASALMVPSISDDTTPESLKDSLAKHEQVTALNRERFIGRSIFFTPPAPKIVVADKPPEDAGPPPEPVKPPPPEIPMEYGGPDIIALLGDQVHVAGPKMIKLGVADEELGLTVLEFVPPWSVKVRWLKKPGNYAEGEYVVEMFNSDYEEVFAKGSPDETTIPGLTQAESEAEPVAEPPRRSGRPEAVED